MNTKLHKIWLDQGVVMYVPPAFVRKEMNGKEMNGTSGEKAYKI